MIPVAELLAIAFSTATMVLLCLGDPKRLRVGRRDHRKDSSQTAGVRRLLVAAGLLPGVAFAIVGNGAALLVWLGGAALTGWLVTLCVSSHGFPDSE